MNVSPGSCPRPQAREKETGLPWSSAERLQVGESISYTTEAMIITWPSGDASGKESACQCRRQQETQVQSLSQEGPLE